MKILIADDEPLNVEILEECLHKAGYRTVSTEDGNQAIEVLESQNDIGIILLDRMMPNMDGMQVLDKIKKDERFKDIPVIMQTAAADTSQVVEGIDAGVYYYLTKPFKPHILLSLVQAAIYDSIHVNELKDHVSKNRVSLNLLKKAYFEFRTVEEAQNLAYTVANAFPDPKHVIVGLSEILINAIEHGNLGLGFKTKNELVSNGILNKELEKRSNNRKNKNKKASLTLERTDTEITITVIDEGEGFDWLDFSTFKPSHAVTPNGRGIMMAKKFSFDSVEYRGKGNEVVCRVSL